MSLATVVAEYLAAVQRHQERLAHEMDGKLAGRNDFVRREIGGMTRPLDHSQLQAAVLELDRGLDARLLSLVLTFIFQAEEGARRGTHLVDIILETSSPAAHAFLEAQIEVNRDLIAAFVRAFGWDPVSTTLNEVRNARWQSLLDNTSDRKEEGRARVREHAAELKRAVAVAVSKCKDGSARESGIESAADHLATAAGRLVDAANGEREQDWTSWRQAIGEWRAATDLLEEQAVVSSDIQQLLSDLRRAMDLFWQSVMSLTTEVDLADMDYNAGHTDVGNVYLALAQAAHRQAA